MSDGLELVVFILGISVALLFLLVGLAFIMAKLTPNKKTDFDIWLKGSEDEIPYNPNNEFDGKFHEN